MSKFTKENYCLKVESGFGDKIFTCFKTSLTLFVFYVCVKGKCSHGGETDLSSSQNPRGGISKDESHSHNANLHNDAVNLAAEATMELLEDIRGAIGNNNYLRYGDRFLIYL